MSTSSLVRSVTFVVGPPRSGTTLLAELLAHHPALAVETQRFHRFHHDVLAFRDRGETFEHLRLTAAEAHPALAAEYQREIVASCREHGREHFVLKISTLSQQIDFCAALVPGARFIQLVRDGYDTACSMEDLRQALEREQGHPRLLGPAPDPLGIEVAERFGASQLAAAASWFYHVSRSALHLRWLGADRFLRLRYDELVRAPRASLQRIVDFLGVGASTALESVLGAVQDRPGGVGTLGYSTTQAAGPTRIGRATRDLDSRVRVLAAPLVVAASRLVGLPFALVEGDLDAAARELGIDGVAWQALVERELGWLALHERTFAPERLLREEARPRAETKPVLVEGAVVRLERTLRDGVAGRSLATLAKADRRTSFLDPTGRWVELAPLLDGEHSVAELAERAGVSVDELAGVLERLHEQAYVGYA